MLNFLKGNFSKSFSLIELIFTLLIIAIVISVASPKLFSSVNESTFIKLRSDIATIRAGLKEYKTKQILQNLSYNIENLDEDENYLFSTILNHQFPVVKTYPSWSKKSNQSYLFHFSKDEELEFSYDKTHLTFTCDTSIDLCKKALE